MTEPVYKYDSKSLRYIRTSVRWDRLIFKGTGFLILTSIFVVLFITVYLEFFQAEEQRTIALETNSFASSRIAFTTELNDLEQQIAGLEKSEGEIHRRLYFAEQDNTTQEKNKLFSEASLNFEKEEFDRILERTYSMAGSVAQQVNSLNASYSYLFWPSKEDVKELQSYPTLSPVHQIHAGMIACGFGNQINPFNKKNYQHTGLDILTETGTPVLAAADGIVKDAQIDQSPGGEGTYVLIDHGNGYQTKYSQMSGTSLRRGQIIRQGQAIGAVGKTGSSIAPHLHYEVMVNGKPVDPVPFLLEHLSSVELEAIRRMSLEKRQSLD